MEAPPYDNEETPLQDAEGLSSPSPVPHNPLCLLHWDFFYYFRHPLGHLLASPECAVH